MAIAEFVRPEDALDALAVLPGYSFSVPKPASAGTPSTGAAGDATSFQLAIRASQDVMQALESAAQKAESGGTVAKERICAPAGGRILLEGGTSGRSGSATSGTRAAPVPSAAVRRIHLTERLSAEAAGIFKAFAAKIAQMCVNRSDGQETWKKEGEGSAGGRAAVRVSEGDQVEQTDAQRAGDVSSSVKAVRDAANRNRERRAQQLEEERLRVRERARQLEQERRRDGAEGDAAREGPTNMHEGKGRKGMESGHGMRDQATTRGVANGTANEHMVKEGRTGGDDSAKGTAVTSAAIGAEAKVAAAGMAAQGQKNGTINVHDVASFWTDSMNKQAENLYMPGGVMVEQGGRTELVAALKAADEAFVKAYTEDEDKRKAAASSQLVVLKKQLFAVWQDNVYENALRLEWRRTERHHRRQRAQWDAGDSAGGLASRRDEEGEKEERRDLLRFRMEERRIDDYMRTAAMEGASKLQQVGDMSAVDLDTALLNTYSGAAIAHDRFVDPSWAKRKSKEQGEGVEPGARSPTRAQVTAVGDSSERAQLAHGAAGLSDAGSTATSGPPGTDVCIPFVNEHTSSVEAWLDQRLVEAFGEKDGDFNALVLGLLRDVGTCNEAAVASKLATELDDAEFGASFAAALWAWLSTKCAGA